MHFIKYFPETKERKRDESDDGSQRSESQLEQWQNRNFCTRGRVQSLEHAFSSSFYVALSGKLICPFCFLSVKLRSPCVCKASVWRHLPVFRSYLYVTVQFGDSGDKKKNIAFHFCNFITFLLDLKKPFV